MGCVCPEEMVELSSLDELKVVELNGADCIDYYFHVKMSMPLNN